MTYIIGQIISLIKLLHSENGAQQIAAGITLGILLGFSPLLSLQGILITLLLFVLRVQLGAAITAVALTKLFAALLMGTLSSIGDYALRMEIFQPLYIMLFNAPLIPYTKFNHTVVMGGFVLSLLIGPIIYFFILIAVKKYQFAIVDKIRNTAIAKGVKASSIVQWYIKYLNLMK